MIAIQSMDRDEYYLRIAEKVFPELTIIDRDAKSKVESWCLQHPQSEKIFHLKPVEIDVTSYEYEKAGFLFNEEGKFIVNKIYICFDDDSFGLTAALKLHRHLSSFQVPIIVRMNHDFGLAHLLHSKESGEFENLYAFGLLGRTCKLDMILGEMEKHIAVHSHND